MSDNKLKVFIVDDSRFSIQIIKDLIDKSKFEVVGEAHSEVEALKKIQNLQVDLVTMDMTLKSSDGLSCSKKILQLKPEVNIIAISSMKDDAIVRKANKVGISHYLQKPIDANEFAETVNKIFNHEQIYNSLEADYEDAFYDALRTNLKRVFEDDFSLSESKFDSYQERYSHGLSVVIGIIGRAKGRMILDTSFEAAQKITESFLGRKIVEKDFIIDSVSEFANIVAGNAASMLNKKIKGLNLRLSPPTVFEGKNLKTTFPKSENVSFLVNVNENRVFLNISLERGNLDESRIY